MANFKRDIGGTSFKPQSQTVFAPNNELARSQAESLTTFVKAAGAGFAAEKGMQQTGAGETGAEADAAVEAAFKQPPAPAPVDSEVEESDPTADTMAKRKAEFLSKADLNDKRLQSAVDQGLISSQEANNRRLQNRKEFASNPISAIFIDSYDRVVGGGRAGAGRKAFFGKTAAEKGAEAALTAEMTQRESDKFMAQNFVKQGFAKNEQEGINFIQEGRANQAALKILQSKDQLTQTESAKKVDIENDNMFAKEAQGFLALLASTPKAEDLRNFGIRMGVLREQMVLGINRANLSESDHKRAVSEVDNRIKEWTTRVNDASYAEYHKKVTTELKSVQSYQETAAYKKMFDSNPALFSAFKNLPPDIATQVFEYTVDRTSSGGQMFANSDMGKTMLASMDDITVDSLKLKGLDTIMTHSPVDDPAVNATGAATVSDPKILNKVAEIQTDDEYAATLSKFKGKQLGQVVSGRDFNMFARNHPAKAFTTIQEMARESLQVQYATHAEIPTRISAISLAKPTRGNVLEGNVSQRKRISSDVTLSPRMLADVSAAEKAARNNPSLWNTKFETINDYLSNLFTSNGPQPKDVTPTKEAEPTFAVDGGAKIKVDESSIKQAEGERLESYVDTEGFLTAGIGHKLSDAEKSEYPEGTAVPQKVVDKWFKEDTAEAKAGAERIISANLLEAAPPEVDQVLTEMVFQLGEAGTKKFVETLDALRIRDYDRAADEMLNSEWAEQTPERAKNASDRIRSLAK
jgi:lysozyme